MYRADEPAYVPNGKLWEEYTQKKPENKRFLCKNVSGTLTWSKLVAGKKLRKEDRFVTLHNTQHWDHVNPRYASKNYIYFGHICICIIG